MAWKSRIWLQKINSMNDRRSTSRSFWKFEHCRSKKSTCIPWIYLWREFYGQIRDDRGRKPQMKPLNVKFETEFSGPGRKKQTKSNENRHFEFFMSSKLFILPRNILVNQRRTEMTKNGNSTYFRRNPHSFLQFFSIWFVITEAGSSLWVIIELSFCSSLTVSHFGIKA